LALLQGLLLCGHCGRHLTVRYKGNRGIYPTNECKWLGREGLSTRSCLQIRCDFSDQLMGKRVLEVMKPKQIEIAIKALKGFERKENAI